jgi:hypothetical protein
MTPDAPRNTTDRLTVGRLLAHGQAPHEFRPRAEVSYFVRLQTERGERTLWSPGLKRALTESRTQPKVGDQIGVKENGIDPVSVVTMAGVNYFFRRRQLFLPVLSLHH